MFKGRVNSLVVVLIVLSIFILNVSAAILIGGNSSGFFNGSIDEFRIYGKVLTSDEILLMYNSSTQNIYSNENLTKTDSLGDYNITISIPENIGDYNITINTTYEGIYGETFQTLTIFNNTAPTLIVNITPNAPISTDSLNCSVNITDSDLIQNVSFIWYVEEIRNSTLDSNITNCNITNFCYSSILVNNLTNGFNYTCSARSYDGIDYGLWYNFSVIVGSSPPTIPILISPINGSTTNHERYTVFNWNASTDPDGDAITYDINITNSLCGDISQTGITPTNFTSPSELCLDYEASYNKYFWQVRACDSGSSCSEWSEKWNFSIEPWVVITVVNNSVDFGGGYIPGDENDTTDNSPKPFLLRNDGNVLSELVNISAQDSFWVLKGLDTEYTKIKARNASELNSFNWSSSVTNWINISGNNVSVVKDLKYQDASDEVNIDLYIKVPDGEPAGIKNMTIIFSWEQTP